MNNFFFNHYKIENYWKKQWLKKKLFKFNPLSKKKPYYILDMFLYPSGAGLHVGHVRGYTVTDIITRWYKLRNFEVCHPIGWDAFGLPAEQYAIKNNVHPVISVLNNINNFRKQLQSLGFAYNYELEINTSKSEYYKVTQEMFIWIYKSKLAFLKECKINWCSQLGCSLANEEIYIKDNHSFSVIGDYPIIQKYEEQWIIKMTKLANSLLSDIKYLNWPLNIIKLQKNWIGKENGLIIPIQNSNINLNIFVINNKYIIKNIFCILISPESSILKQISLNKDEKALIEVWKNQTNVLRKKNYCDFIKLNFSIFINEFNIKVPIFVASPLVNNYFHSNNGILITNDNYKLWKNSLDYLKLDNLLPKPQKLNNNLKTKILYNLDDWIFSRQRFWGEPIPIYYDSKKNIFCETGLPLKLPIINNNIDEICKLKKPLSYFTEWCKFKKNNEYFFRDLNVMPQWAGSCWYYLAYLWKSAKLYWNDNNLLFTDKKCQQIYNKFLPVNLYVGGKEHAVTHLLYSRFWHKILYKYKVIKCKEPFFKLYNQGIVLGNDGTKMSKSKNNFVNPDELCRLYGADALRCYEMFVAPVGKTLHWSNKNLKSIRQWLDRFAKMYYLYLDKDKPSFEYSNLFYTTINKINELMEKFKFNIIISKLMVFVNYCYKNKCFYYKYLRSILIIFSCFCPFISEEIWFKIFKENRSILNASWPESKKIINKNLNLKIIIQVGKKTKFIIIHELKNKKTVSEKEIKKILFNNDKFKNFVSKFNNLFFILKPINNNENWICNFKLK